MPGRDLQKSLQREIWGVKTSLETVLSDGWERRKYQEVDSKDKVVLLFGQLPARAVFCFYYIEDPPSLKLRRVKKEKKCHQDRKNFI